MSEDDDDESKTEDPTAKRLSDARERGQVIMSREITAAAVLLAAVISLGAFGPMGAERLLEVMRSSLATAGEQPADAAALGQHLLALLVQAGIVVAGPLLLVMLFGVVAVLGQTRLLVTAENLKPKFSKLNPWAGLKRIVSVQGLVEFAKGLVKLSLIAVVAFIVLRPMFDRVELFLAQPQSELNEEMVAMTAAMLRNVLMLMAVIAGADYMWQRRNFLKQLRMSREDLKEEMKNSEGNPEIKGRLRQMRQQRARNRMMQAVPTATVVVINPTHFAVAMKYETGMPAPMVVAKGADLVALRIRELAAEAKVPVVENPPLARALFAAVEVDREIPEDQYKAVAELISYVYSLRQQRRR